MISDLSRITYKGYLYLLGLFRREPEEPPVPPEINDVISKITAAQNASRQRLDQISTEASALLKTLTEKESEKIALWRRDIGGFLMDQGVDCKCLDEFLKDPSLENINALRKKYPLTRK